jgi:hypothetical protein
MEGFRNIALLLILGARVAAGADSSNATNAASHCPTPTVTPNPDLVGATAPPKSADLNSVVTTIESALQCYQDNRGGGSDALPPLIQADFDFKTTTAKTGGLSISFFIFKLSGTHEKDVTNDITFSYKVKVLTPPGTKGPGFTSKNQPPLLLSDALVADMQGIATAIKSRGQAAGLPLDQAKIMMQFGVVNDGNITINAPVQLVTIGGSGDYKKTEIQSVTLTFGKNPK